MSKTKFKKRVGRKTRKNIKRVINKTRSIKQIVRKTHNTHKRRHIIYKGGALTLDDYTKLPKLIKTREKYNEQPNRQYYKILFDLKPKEQKDIFRAQLLTYDECEKIDNEGNLPGTVSDDDKKNSEPSLQDNNYTKLEEEYNILMKDTLSIFGIDITTVEEKVTSENIVNIVNKYMNKQTHNFDFTQREFIQKFLRIRELEKDMKDMNKQTHQEEPISYHPRR